VRLIGWQTHQIPSAAASDQHTLYYYALVFGYVGILSPPLDDEAKAARIQERRQAAEPRTTNQQGEEEEDGEEDGRTDGRVTQSAFLFPGDLSLAKIRNKNEKFEIK
jgi:hypothetical protein